MAASTSGFRPGRKQSLLSLAGTNSSNSYGGGPSSSSSSYSTGGPTPTTPSSSYDPSINGNSVYSNGVNGGINGGLNNNSSGSLSSASGSAVLPGGGQRTPTVSMTSSTNNSSVNGGIGAPIAANSMANKPAVAASSLYQTCLSLRNRLYRVPNFGSEWLDEEAMISHGTTSSSLSMTNSNDGTSTAPSSPKASASTGGMGIIGSDDPVTSIWAIARLGAPLCSLYNHLNPETKLEINPNVNHQTLNDCKKHVARFVMAIQHKLKWNPDDVFTVSNVYLSDTNGFVKVSS